MVDSVNPGSGTPPTTPTPQTNTDATEGASGVSSGYSSEDSVSFSSEDGSGEQSQDSSVDLDFPASGTPGAEDFLQRGLDSRLSAFRSIVADFNVRFKADNVDLADTKTLLLAIKGMVSDTRVLLNAETIDYSSSLRSSDQQHRLDAVKNKQSIKAEIKERENQINDANQQISNNNLALTEENQSKLAKESALISANNSGNTSGVAQLQAELTSIEASITLLEQDNAALNTKIQGLQAANATSQSGLVRAERLAATVSENIFNVRQLLGRVRERYDGAATQTGEDEVTELKRENRAAEIQLDKNEERLREVKRNIKEVDSEIWDEQIKAADKQADTASNELIPGVVSPAQIKALATLFPPQDPLLLLQKLRGTSNQPSPQQLSNTAEALALILQATPPQVIPDATVSRAKPESEPQPQQAVINSNVDADIRKAVPNVTDSKATPQQIAPDVTASEAKPGEAPHLGDNLSLEGANNPQAFALLLLQKNMDVLKDNVGNQEKLAALETLQNDQIDNLVNELQQVETMVAEALEESEKTDAVIRRSPV